MLRLRILRRKDGFGHLRRGSPLDAEGPEGRTVDFQVGLQRRRIRQLVGLVKHQVLAFGRPVVLAIEAAVDDHAG